MTTIQEYKRFEDFAEFNLAFGDKNPFVFHNVIRSIHRVLNSEVGVFRAFNIFCDEDVACAMIIDNECLIYCSKFNDKMTQMLSEGLQFEKFNKFNFFGNKALLDALFELNEVEYSEQKHRIYYECTSPVRLASYASGQAEAATIERLKELSSFSEVFTQEFYNEEKPDVNQYASVLQGIENGSLFQWVVKNELVGIAGIMSEAGNVPVIGQVFTAPNHRGKGIATSLVSFLTNKILSEGHLSCMLMADGYNPASNKAFRKVGYEVIDEQVLRFKEK